MSNPSGISSPSVANIAGLCSGIMWPFASWALLYLFLQRLVGAWWGNPVLANGNWERICFGVFSLLIKRYSLKQTPLFFFLLCCCPVCVQHLPPLQPSCSHERRQPWNAGDGTARGSKAPLATSLCNCTNPRTAPAPDFRLREITTLLLFTPLLLGTLICSSKHLTWKNVFVPFVLFLSSLSTHLPPPPFLFLQSLDSLIFQTLFRKADQSS